MEREQKETLLRIALAGAMLAALHFLPLTGWLRALAYLIPYAVIGWEVLYEAARGIAHGEVFDENFLMAVATVGAMALGKYSEAVAVLLFYQTGELFEDVAVGRSRKNIGALMDIRPDSARLEGEGGLAVVRPEEVAPGSVIVVEPGEKIPLDGAVIEGESTLDTAALTGESLPRAVRAGDEAVSGCINLSGVLRIRTTKPFGESTVSKILDLVENAGSRKSRSEAFITRFARVYTPAVCSGALALALLPPLVSLLLGREALWSVWIYRALTFLVISCPCALVISIPLTFFAGLGGASREGVLVKGSQFLESLAKTRTVVFDKTGTMTQGVFAVSGVHHSTMEPERLVEYAALAELYSTHPIGQSLREACAAPLDPARVREVREHSGRGITALIDGREVAVGNGRLMEELGIEAQECRSAGTVVHVALNGEYAGHILIADKLKPHAFAAVQALRRNGVRRLVMLTGDTESAAREAGEELELNEVFSGLLPGDKVERVEQLLREKEAGGALAFVGDGINDAPVLARADVGIAMGALGSDAAIEAADVVLMDDDPLRLATAIRLARKCLRIVYENIFFAVGVKLVCLALGALGLAGMWTAVFADVGVMVLAVLNAVRAMLTKSCREVA